MRRRGENVIRKGKGEQLGEKEKNMWRREEKMKTMGKGKRNNRIEEL